MKYFMMFAVMAMLAITTAPAQAQLTFETKTSIDTTDLTDKQKAELALKAAKMKEVISAPNTPAKVLEYATLGASIGQALASTAGALGVEVNKFASTGVGRLSVFLIIWHLFGSMAVHVFAGTLLLLFVVPLWIWSFRNMCTKRIKTISTGTSESGKPFKTVEYGDRPKDADGNAMIHWLILVIAVILSSIITFTW